MILLRKMTFIGFGGWLGFLLVLLAIDTLPPIWNVQVWAEGEYQPGEAVELKWKYSRIFPASISRIDRAFVCGDGIVRKPNVVTPKGDNIAWPSGMNASASIHIQVPPGAPPGNCYYSGVITYQRVLLPDLILKMPGNDILVRVTAD